MDRDSCSHLGILEVFDALHRPFAQAMARMPLPVAPDDEVDPAAPAVPVGQRDEE